MKRASYSRSARLNGSFAPKTAVRPDTGRRRRRIAGSSEAINLTAERREEGLRLGEFGELLGRREALDGRRQHGVRVGVAIGRAIELCQRQRGAQLKLRAFATAR